MAIIKSHNQTPVFGSFFSDFLDNNFWGNSLTNNNMSMNPAVNIKEKDNEYQIEVAAPGMPKEKISVHVDNNVLTIEGQNSYENEDKEDGRYTRREFSSTSFERRFTLPQYADASNIMAKFKDGILNINIPKKEEARKAPRKEIKIGE
jgi:HSP20 family protein